MSRRRSPWLFSSLLLLSVLAAPRAGSPAPPRTQKLKVISPLPEERALNNGSLRQNQLGGPNPDLVYFPEQIDYLFLHHQHCSSDAKLVFHPGTRRCYSLGSQGPCHLDHVIQLDPRLRLPVCAPPR